MSLDGPAIANHETFEETVRRLFGEAEAARGTGFAVRVPAHALSAICSALLARSERADIVVAASDKDESGWLIELPRHSVRMNETPLWWAGGGIKPHMVFDEPVWTLDAVKAVRFCRKEDAIRAIASWEDVGLIRQVKILEHLFLQGNT